MRRASLVVLRAGTTKGLDWEIRNAMRILRPSQLLMILPYGREDYAAFRSLLTSATDIDLPEKQPHALLATFNEGWKPVFLEPVGQLHDTLAPFFARNGIEAPRVRWWDAFALFFR
jgi:hypothetical protein